MLSFITRWTILRIDVIYERTDSTSLFITNIMAVIYHHKRAGTVSKKGQQKKSGKGTVSRCWYSVSEHSRSSPVGSEGSRIAFILKFTLDRIVTFYIGIRYIQSLHITGWT